MNRRIVSFLVLVLAMLPSFASAEEAVAPAPSAPAPAAVPATDAAVVPAPEPTVPPVVQPAAPTPAPAPTPAAAASKREYGPIMRNANPFAEDYQPRRITFYCFEPESGKPFCSGEAAEDQLDVEEFQGRRGVVAGIFSEKDASAVSMRLPTYKGYDSRKEVLHSEEFILDGDLPHGAMGQTFHINFSQQNNSSNSAFGREVPLIFTYDEAQSDLAQGKFVFTIDLIYNPDAQQITENRLRLTKTIQWRPAERFSWDVSYTFVSLDPAPFRLGSDTIIRPEEAELPPFAAEFSFGPTWGPGIGPHLEHSSRFDIININIHPRKSTTEFYWEESIEEFFEEVNPFLLGKYSDSRWIGVDNRYFLAAIMRPDDSNVQIKPGEEDLSQPHFPFAIVDQRAEQRKAREQFERNEMTSTYIMMMYRPFDLEPGVEVTRSCRFFIGPKDRQLLQSASGGGLALDMALDRTSWWGGALFNLVAIGLEWSLTWLFELVGSWGVAIILMTIGLKIIFHPFLQKGMVTQEKMKFIQPKMAALNKRFKDPMERQKHIRELLKKEGVSILGGGCLTFLPQIPIFIGLVIFMPHYVDIRGESFLWIQDLGNPDVIGGHFDFWPHEFHLLPVLMMLISIAQSWFMPMSAPGGDQKQAELQRKMFMYLMPIMFLFIFWTFPAALVLFWTIQTVLQVGHQWLIRRMIQKKKDSGEIKENTYEVPAEKGHMKGRGGGKKSRNNDSGNEDYFASIKK